MSDKAIGIIIDFDSEYNFVVLKKHASPDGDPILIKPSPSPSPSGSTSLHETKLALVKMLEQYDAGRLPGVAL
jgi:hypothetical protein